MSNRDVNIPKSQVELLLGMLGLGVLLIVLVVATVALYALWVRIRRRELGPHLGAIFSELGTLDLKQAFPLEQPDDDLIRPEVRDYASGPSPTEELSRANVWAAAAEQYLEKHLERIPPKTKMTTYGFANLNGQTRLSVIHYVDRLAAFRLVKQKPIVLGDHEFPVIVRPWAVKQHASNRTEHDGNCYVVFKGNSGSRCVGLLTSAHAIRPENAPVGSEVEIKVSREPTRGVLRRKSTVMDAALVELPHYPVPSTTINNSRVVGLKPIRLIRGGGRPPVDCHIFERTGIILGTVLGGPNQEPPEPAGFALTAKLKKGDSGCLGLDMEFANQGGVPMPYLIYQGTRVFNLLGERGHGFFLEQARIVWDMDFLPFEAIEQMEDHNG